MKTVTIWLPALAIATVAAHVGFARANGWWVFASFTPLLTAFACHVIANAVFKTDFTAREVAVSLVLSASALIAVCLSTLFVDGFADRFFLPVVGGATTLVAAIAFYMVTRYGVRSAFEKFDVIRDFHPRPTSVLPHRGGRR